MDRRDALRRLVTMVPAVTAACAVGRRRPLLAVEQEAGGTVAMDGALVRVALAASAPSTQLAGTGAWRLIDGDGRGDVVLRSGGTERWRIEQREGRLRAVRDDGAASGWRGGPLVARPVDDRPLVVGGRRYRGEVAISAATSGLLVVNRVGLEDYLRGVVPLEIGDLPAAERAAVEAQAVAARSYTRSRLHDARGAAYDLTAGVTDQVYGGVDAERPVSDAAVRATAGLVLLYRGRLVSAPYHSTCGGSTCAPTEVWRSAPEPHLQRVSDRRPGGGCYCDASPRFAWTRTFERDELRRLLDRYLAAYAEVPSGGAGEVLELRVEETTPSGRAGVLALRTTRGIFRLRGNEIRFVLRERGGEILNSTYFTVRRPPVRRGESPPVATLEGNGYGHGVGMCQWGAIGRARGGFDFRAILRTYYPGTSVGYAE
ncbi:MAG TPA: SpoIID/LytB domain-containing protein [Gemmatimonadaceae bacterium]|nr:SpoIID/LytB domain-containing protein [Gemmatimonadaceae bacterium]